MKPSLLTSGRGSKADNRIEPLAKWKGNPRWFTRLSFFLASVAAASAASAASHSQLTLGPSTLQSILIQQLFKNQGRWFLLNNGPCFAFLEHPQVRITNGRIYLDAHLTSRLGIPVGSNCVGGGFASNVTFSGQPRGSGSTLTLDNVRLEHVEDESTAAALDLMQQATQDLPRALSIDVLAAAHGAPLSSAGFSPKLDAFRIIDVSTPGPVVLIRFELELSAP